MRFWRTKPQPVASEYDPSYWIDDAKRAYVQALVARLVARTSTDPFKDLGGLPERIEHVIAYWAGDYDYEAEVVIDRVNERFAELYATNAGLAEVEARLDKLEAVDTRSPLSIEEIGTVIDTHLDERLPADLADKLNTLAETAVQHRERLTHLEAPAGLTNVEEALVETMRAVEATKSDEHTHHWKIGSSHGVCDCGAERDFTNEQKKQTAR